MGRKTGSVVLVSEIIDNIFFRTSLQPTDFALHLLRVHSGATRPHSRTLEEIVNSDGVQHEASGIGPPKIPLDGRQAIPRNFGDFGPHAVQNHGILSLKSTSSKPICYGKFSGGVVI